jgi:protease I
VKDRKFYFALRYTAPPANLLGVKEMVNIKGKNALMIIAHRNFRDEELINTKKVIEGAGGNVTIASTELTTATGMFGATATPNITIDKVNVDDYDAIIFVGGMGAETYFNHPKALTIAREAYSKNKIVSAICIAPSILANADLLRGKKATVWGGDKYINILRSKGAQYTGESVTQDGRIITADGPSSAKKFGKVIVKNLK